ncbi:MAG: MFS transporter [Veillonella sp.]|uniref:MFS transporter n=1 Tax=Veillonella TaxID=29465 RepID=UPI00241E8FB0|nr:MULTISPECIES: MFS transporter [Veillonella]MBS5751797.1 MFS transporter [Veillonella parvula]MDU3887152.1 MFS transporter [Veillonella sp.]MDU4111799.1 MFS transporter [Veillonella parvula]MDU4141776.1 MFS transporter [Veillonella parvula]MDU6904054.1 MFS transporter [Veillonella sp.]
MDSNRLWSPAFTNYGISSGILYMTQYVLVAALPIVITSELSGSDLDAGLAMTYFQIGTILCRIFAGRLIDGFNKRIVLLISTALFFIIMGLFNFTTSLEAVFVLRGLHGVVFALGTTVMATLAVLVLPPNRKGEGVNMFAIFSNIAMVLGPAIGLYALSSYGSMALYIFLTVMTGLAMVLSNIIPLSKELTLPKQSKYKGWHISQFIENKSLPWALMGLFIGFTYSGVLVFIPIELNSMGAGIWGSAFFAIFALMIIISRPIVGKIYARYGSKIIIYTGLGLFILGLFALGLAITPLAILFTAPLLGLGYGAAQPAFQALAIQSAPIERAGVSTATYFLALDISVGAGSVILAVLASAWGYQYLYMFTALVMVIALALYHIWVKRCTPLEL